MAIWGSGNLDSDSAAEFLESYLKKLVETIRDTIFLHTAEKSDDWYYESYGETQLMPAVDMLLTLTKHYDYPVHSATGITKSEVAKWKEKYLKIFDNVIMRYSDDDEYISDRRKVIKSSFEKLERVISQYDL